jgi:hypothetical protein
MSTNRAGGRDAMSPVVDSPRRPKPQQYDVVVKKGLDRLPELRFIPQTVDWHASMDSSKK